MSEREVPSDIAPTVRGLSPGQQHFGRFTLVRPLGRGGMGVIWLAHDQKLGEEVALKFLPDLVRWDPAALAELKAETRLARQLSHPNIVRIHDLFEDPQQAAIAMEFIDGRTLTEVRLAQPQQVLEPEQITPWLEQLASALDYAHQEVRLIHRDLKPSNLMVTAEGRIKVTDFGVACALGESMLRVSQLATTGGTLLYMSPQQALGEVPTPRDDIYALGATFYELLTGKPPFHTGNIIAQVERRKPDPVTERRRQLGIAGVKPLPPAWEEVIAACLAKDPAARPSSVREAIAPLLTEDALAQSTAASSEAWAWRRPVLLAGLAGALALQVWSPLKRQEVARGGEAPAPASPQVAAPTAPVAPGSHPSDATRVYASWNFDGQAEEGTGRDWTMVMSRVTPAKDRFGRIDRALSLNGFSALQADGLPAGDWAASRPFSVALWVRPAAMDEETILVSLRSERQDDFYWDLSLMNGGVRFSLGRTHIDNPDTLRVEASGIRPGQWSHVAASSDGEQLRIYLNGQELGRAPLTRNRAAVMRDAPALMVGYFEKFDPRRFAGAVDELKLWPRALAPEEVAQLAAQEAPPRFTQTKGLYNTKDDLAAAVVLELGPQAAIADWDDLRRWHADDIVAWCAETKVPLNAGGPLLQRAGRLTTDNGRQFFINHFEGKKPDYYFAHDELGGMRLALGSWFGVTGRVLARLPHLPPTTLTLSAGPEKVMEQSLAWERPLGALAVEWVQEVKPQATGEMRGEFTLRDGRRVMVACAPSGDGAFALAMGDDSQPQLTRQLAATFGQLAFTVVVQDGRLSFRAVRTLGASIVFQQEVPLDIMAHEVVQVRLAGVDRATLTLEK